MLTIAGIQMGCGLDRRANLEKALGLAAIAAERGAKVIGFPECFAWPWFPREPDRSLFAWAESVPGPVSEALAAFARERGVAVVAPIFERGGQLDYFSTALVFDGDGKLVGRYRKAHIPELPDYQEKFYFQPGDQGFPVFATGYAAIGVQISWDNFFPEGTRVLGLGGAELVFSPTSASVVASHQKWERAMIGAAVYNGFYVFRVNRVKGEDHLPFYGKSFCVDPNGDFVVEPSGSQEGVILAEVEPSSVKIAREDWPFLKDRRPELYKALS